jgi:hypothetical protein
LFVLLFFYCDIIEKLLHHLLDFRYKLITADSQLGKFGNIKLLQIFWLFDCRAS